MQRIRPSIVVDEVICVRDRQHVRKLGAQLPPLEPGLCPLEFGRYLLVNEVLTLCSLSNKDARILETLVSASRPAQVFH